MTKVEEVKKKAKSYTISSGNNNKMSSERIGRLVGRYLCVDEYPMLSIKWRRTARRLAINSGEVKRKAEKEEKKYFFFVTNLHTASERVLYLLFASDHNWISAMNVATATDAAAAVCFNPKSADYLFNFLSLYRDDGWMCRTLFIRFSWITYT